MLYTGQCQCGQSRFEIELPQPLAQYSPRQCDCDFCMSNNVAYISDPDGILFIDKSLSQSYQQQGNRLAKFIRCSQCRHILGATYHSIDADYAAVNANLLADAAELGEPVVVSPKSLTANEKVSRWKKLWLNVVYS